MKLLGRIPVEPLDDERLTNIERRVVTGAAGLAPARVPRRWGFAAAAVCAIAAGVIGWKVASVRAAMPLVVDTAPIHVTTEARRSTLDIGDATIESDAATAFVVTRPDGGVLVDMTRGKVELQVGKRANRPPLVVRAGDTDVIVVGTHFSVDYGDGTGEVDVRVTEGVVRVVRHHAEARVAAGSAWQTARGVIAIADAGPVRVANVEPIAATTATATGHGSDDLAIDLGRPPEVLHDRTSHVPDAHVPATQHLGAGSAAGASAGSATHALGATEPGSDLQQLIRAQPIEPAVEIGEPDATRAVPKYYDIVIHSKGDEASRAFYSIAVLQATRLGRTGDALTTLDQYLRRFSGGKEYVAALWLRVRILCTRAIDDRCRQAAYTYQHQAPGSAASHLAERITIAD